MSAAMASEDVASEVVNVQPLSSSSSLTSMASEVVGFGVVDAKPRVDEFSSSASE